MQRLPDLGNSIGQVREGSVVDNDEVGSRCVIRVVGLARHPSFDIALLDATGRGPIEPDRRIRGHRDPPPGFIEPRADDRHLDDDGDVACRLGATCQLRGNRRMGDAFEPCELGRVVEDHGSQRGAIDVPRFTDHVRPTMRHLECNRVIPTEDLVTDSIGLDHDGARCLEQRRNRGLACTDATRHDDAEPRRTGPDGAGRDVPLL